MTLFIGRNPFVGVGGSASGASHGGHTIYATGWTKSSVVLRVFAQGKWSRYLLPKASHSWDHAWNTEWMRIRHAVTERLLMDVHGMFYELVAAARIMVTLLAPDTFTYAGPELKVPPSCSNFRLVS